MLSRSGRCVCEPVSILLQAVSLCFPALVPQVLASPTQGLKMSTRLLSVLAFVSALPTTLAWGAMGHETIAYVATNFVASSTKTYFQSLLGDTSTDYLASVASWADSYR